MSILNFWLVFWWRHQSTPKTCNWAGKVSTRTPMNGEQVLPRPQEDLKNPQVQLRDQVLVKTWQEKGSPNPMFEKWTGPYQVLVTSTSVKVKGLSAWVHNSRIKPYGLQEGEMGTETLKPEDNYSCEPVEDLRPCSGGTPSNLPQISKRILWYVPPLSDHVSLHSY